jgi:hypothetical protein
LSHPPGVGEAKADAAKAREMRVAVSFIVNRRIGILPEV